jgi:hypothetical protein
MSTMRKIAASILAGLVITLLVGGVAFVFSGAIHWGWYIVCIPFFSAMAFIQIKLYKE